MMTALEYQELVIELSQTSLFSYYFIMASFEDGKTPFTPFQE